MHRISAPTAAHVNGNYVWHHAQVDVEDRVAPRCLSKISFALAAQQHREHGEQGGRVATATNSIACAAEQGQALRSFIQQSVGNDRAAYLASPRLTVTYPTVHDLPSGQAPSLVRLGHSRIPCRISSARQLP